MKNLNRISAAVLFLILTVSFSVSAQQSDDVKKASKEVLKNADALVWVKYSIKDISSIGTLYSLGTIISDDGVVVLQGVNSQRFAAYMKQIGKEGQEEPVADEVKIEFANGKELDAEYLAYDKDYSILFVKITKDSLEKEKVKLSPLSYESKAKPEVADTILRLARMSDKFGSAPMVKIDTIGSVVTKPIKAYGISQFYTDLTPSFNIEGELIGFTAQYTTGKDSKSAMRSDESIVVSMDNLKSIFDQAKKAKPKESKKPPKEDEKD